MKHFTYIALFIGLCLQSYAQGPEITSWYLNTDGSTGYNSISADIQSVCYDSDFVYISATGIPSYSIGPWTGNPNTPSNQNWGFKIPRNPAEQTATKSTVGLGQQGVLLNGVVIYSPSDGRSYNNDGIWEYDAWDTEGSTMDAASGHADQGGNYHTHAAPNQMYSSDSSQHSPIIGYAFDGFPIYGPYGYSDPNDANSNIKRIESSYQTRNITDRTTLADGTTLQASQYGPAINTTYPLGYFMQDYVFSSSSGDLDKYNGRFSKTPEYPNGIYAYFTTIEADHSTPAFPYFFGPYEFYGIVEADNTGPSGAQVTAPGNCNSYTGATGIQQFNTNEVGISTNPNPVHFQLSIQQKDAKDLVLNIYNGIGQIVKTEMIRNFNSILNVSDLNPGIYLLQFEDKESGHIYTQKIVKQ